MKAAVHAENESGWRIMEVENEAHAARIAASDFNARYTVDAEEVAAIEADQAAFASAM